MYNTVPNNTTKVYDYKKEISSNVHLDKINEIIILFKRSIVLTASIDSTLKILNIKDLSVLKELSFRPKIDESNYIFRSMEINEGKLVTLQSPMRGNSYITEWEMNNFNPIRTKKVASSATIVMRKVGKCYILGEVSGNVIHVDIDSLKVTSDNNYHVLATKSICKLTNSRFLTSSPDQMIATHEVKESSLISFFSFFKVLLLGFIIYLVITRFEQLKKINN